MVSIKFSLARQEKKSFWGQTVNQKSNYFRLTKIIWFIRWHQRSAISPFT